MRGSIVRRGKRYHAVVDLPPGPDGRRRQKWLSGFATRREAEAALSAATTEVHTGRYLEPSTMTLRRYLTEDWLPASAARVRASTLHSSPANGRRAAPQVEGDPAHRSLGPQLVGDRHPLVLAQEPP